MGRVYYVIRSKTVMKPPGGLRKAGSLNAFGYACSESNDIVADFPLDFEDAFDGEGGVLPEEAGSLLGDFTAFGEDFGGGEFDLEPLLEAVLVAPDSAHFGAGVAGYHDWKTLQEKDFRGKTRLDDDKPGVEPALAEGLAGREFGVPDGVVLLAQVPKNEHLGFGGELRSDVLAGSVVRQMSKAGENSLLEVPRVRADLEEIGVVVGFEEEEVGAAEMVLDAFREVAEVSGDSDLDAVGGEGIADGVGGVVREGEGLDVEVAEVEGCARLESFQRRRGGAAEVEQRRRLVREKNRDAGAELAVDDGQAGDVVGVFVGDEDSVETGGVFIDGGEACEGLLAVDPGVNEDAGLFRGEKDRIAGARRGEHARFDDGGPP